MNNPKPSVQPALRDSFTLDSYRAHLEQTIGSYPRVDFSILGERDLATRRFCLLRHDLDYSPARALEMAEVEAALGVKSTYTVLLTGSYYSPFEEETRRILLKIVSLGHEIGLHFDAAWHQIDDEGKLSEAIAWEAGILNRLLGISVRMFAYHNTTPFSLSCTEPQYAGLWNAYAGALRENTSYVSDSNGYWIYRRWSDLLDEAPERLYVLTHPEWWDRTEATPAERICSQIEARASSSWRGYVALLEGLGRQNKSDIPEALTILPARLGTMGEAIVRQWLTGGRRDAFAALARELKEHVQGEPQLADLYHEVVEGRADDQDPRLRDGLTRLALLLDAKHEQIGHGRGVPDS